MELWCAASRWSAPSHRSPRTVREPRRLPPVTAPQTRSRPSTVTLRRCTLSRVRYPSHPALRVERPTPSPASTAISFFFRFSSGKTFLDFACVPHYTPRTAYRSLCEDVGHAGACRTACDEMSCPSLRVPCLGGVGRVQDSGQQGAALMGKQGLWNVCECSDNPATRSLAGSFSSHAAHVHPSYFPCVQQATRLRSNARPFLTLRRDATSLA